MNKFAGNKAAHQRSDCVHDKFGMPSAPVVSTPSRGGRCRSGSGLGGTDRSSSAALEIVMRQHGVDEAWGMLEEMQRQGVTTDKFTVSRMLMKTVGDGRRCLNTSAVYRGIALVEQYINLQPTDVDEVLFNALLDTCCRLKDLHRLEAIVTRMRELKVTPSPVTLGILVKTYGQAGDLQKVLQVWDEMEKQRGLANAVTFGCMIDACVKCGNLAKANEIFQGMKNENKHRNTILYTTLIKGHGLERDLKRALALFQEMHDEGVPYNTITYNSIIDVCIKCSDVPTAECLLRQMTSYDSLVKPDLITFSTLLKGYCHIGDIDKALQVAESIKRRGLCCDELVYNTLMDGCVKANDIAVGIGLFEEMVQNGMRPSSITHSILARLYQRGGFEDDAGEAVASLYQHHGLERPTRKTFQRRNAGGCSLTDSTSMGSYLSHQSWQSTSPMCYPRGAKASGVPGFGHGTFSSASPSLGPTPYCSPQVSPLSSASGGLYLPIEALQQMGPVPPMPGAPYEASPYACSNGGTTPCGMFALSGGEPQVSPGPFQCDYTPSGESMSVHSRVPQIQCARADGNSSSMQSCHMQNLFVVHAAAPLPPFGFGNLVGSLGGEARNLSGGLDEQYLVPVDAACVASPTVHACTMNSMCNQAGPGPSQGHVSVAELWLDGCADSKNIHLSLPHALPACTAMPGRFGG